MCQLPSQAGHRGERLGCVFVSLCENTGFCSVVSLWDWSVEGGGLGGGAEKPALLSLPWNHVCIIPSLQGGCVHIVYLPLLDLKFVHWVSKRI